MRYDDDDDRDDRDEDDRDEDERRSLRTPDGRVYVHRRCGGMTKVSGGDYSHICDPFWPCTGTYCCGCSGFVSLSEVRWADTEEPVSEYRRRLAAETPLVIKLWRYGLGAVVGGILGVMVGVLCAVLAQVRQGQVVGFMIGGGLVGAILIYLIGTMILNSVYNIDYRRMK
jgi:hypothetical protein